MPSAQAQEQARPNILVIFGDDIGQTNISAYSMGLVGYRTPNIDRIAKEGMMFTDYYAENSCTAGRSSFITGQTPKRTGLSKVGIPGAPVGLQPRDITIAQALKPWATPPANSARTTWATGTSSCRPTTVSTNSSATCTT
jgi:arylsulfatase A-like enzyme